MSYLLRLYAVPASLEEAVTADLWAAGTLGVQVGELEPGPGAAEGAAEPETLRLRAWFPAAGPGDPDPPDPLAHRLEEGVEALAVERRREEDWLAPWRRRSRPFDLGRSFRVDPREPEEAGGDGEGSERRGVPAAGTARRLLYLPARSAFGVGSHASTRLAVELLEDLPLAGRDIVDVGTGTGVLAFAALHLGARSAVAHDLDPAAAFAARDNARRNRFAPLVYAGPLAALSPRLRFDWALVNVVPERIAGELPSLARRLGAGRAGGGMVLSGILAERGDEVLRRLADLGFAERGRAEEDEWVALRLERPAAAGGAA